MSIKSFKTLIKSGKMGNALGSGQIVKPRLKSLALTAVMLAVLFLTHLTPAWANDYREEPNISQSVGLRGLFTEPETGKATTPDDFLEDTRVSWPMAVGIIVGVLAVGIAIVVWASNQRKSKRTRPRQSGIYGTPQMSVAKNGGSSPGAPFGTQVIYGTPHLSMAVTQTPAGVATVVNSESEKHNNGAVQAVKTAVANKSAKEREMEAEPARVPIIMSFRNAGNLTDTRGWVETRVFVADNDIAKVALSMGRHKEEPNVPVRFSDREERGGTGRKAIKFVELSLDGVHSGAVEVTISYSEEEIAGYDEYSLFLAYWEGRGWKKAANIAAYTGAGTIAGSIPVSVLTSLKGTSVGLGGRFIGKQQAASREHSR